MPIPTSDIDAFESRAGTLHKAIEGLTPADMTAYPVPGTWSIHELIVHVMESDLIAVHRMKRIIAEEKPLLIGYNETAFVKTLNSHAIDVRQACDLFRLNRLMMAGILRRLPEAAFDRVGVHNENGMMSLRQMIPMYANHVDHHMKFLREKRAKLGKPLGW